MTLEQAVAAWKAKYSQRYGREPTVEEECAYIDCWGDRDRAMKVETLTDERTEDDGDGNRHVRQV
jgi:hypothetical protein